MPIDIAVVPVAGQGNRLLPLTKSQPKEMLPVGRKPAVQFVVEEMAKAGMRRLLFVTGPGKDSIENHFDVDKELIAQLRETGKEELLAELDFERRQLAYCFTRQRRQLGLGHAILCAEPFVAGKPFVVALGDSLIGTQAESAIVARMVDRFEKDKVDAVVAVEEVPPAMAETSGIVRPAASASGEVFELAGLVEKPSSGKAPSNLAVAARYVLGPALFDDLRGVEPDRHGQIQLTDALNRRLQQGGRVLGMRLAAGERRFDIGSFDSYFQAFVEFALADPRDGRALRQWLTARLREFPQE